VKIKLHRQPKGKIKTCTIIAKNGKYYACLSCEDEADPLPQCSSAVGVDLGVKHLAITSDGEFHDRRQQRSVARKKKGSNRRRKTVRELAKQHEHVANQRKDYAHKVSRKLVDTNGLIAFEDLNVKGMVKNHNLAKSIADSGWSQLVQFTTYKAESAGRRVVLVNPYNTSQMCSNVFELRRHRQEKAVR
jgi:putative transposase